MNKKLIRCLVKVRTEHGGTHHYAALFPCTADALMDAIERFHQFGAYSITVRPMQ